MKTLNLNKKTSFAGMMILGISAILTPIAHAQVNINSSLEFKDGPTSKLDLEAIKNIKQFASNANTNIGRLLNTISQLNDSQEIKTRLYNGINNIIEDSKDSRSILLLTQSLQAGIILVKLIDQQSVNRGL